MSSAVRDYQPSHRAADRVPILLKHTVDVIAPFIVELLIPGYLQATFQLRSMSSLLLQS